MRKNASPIMRMPTEELRALVQQSKCITHVLNAMGLPNAGNSTYTLKRRMESEGIDYAHFTGYHAHNRPGNYQDLSAQLVVNAKTNRVALKAKLIKQGLLKNECSECGIGPMWNNKKLTLTLDHINGVYNDNRLENLRLLCPNCHSQTPTFAGRNSRSINIPDSSIR